MYARLGNANAVEAIKQDDGSFVYEPVEGTQVTTFEFPEGIPLTEALLAVRDAWKYHSALDADDLPAKPEWVESDSAGLATLLAEEFGGIPTSDPDGK